MVSRRCELFRIRHFRRTYNRAEGKFLVNISYETAAPQPSERVVAVAESFGLGLDQWEKFIIYDNVELKISPCDVVYITGDSGSGKSVLLKAIKADLGPEAIDVADIGVEPEKPLIETIGESIEEALELLSKVGLNDAFLFLRTYNQLSDGQKYRYKIAKLIESEKQWWILDEFCATLDRDTAKIVAWNLQKIARQEGKAVVAATTHRDLQADLAPDLHVHKRFGKEITVNCMESCSKIPCLCSLVPEMNIEKGTTADWRALSGFHYRSHNVGAVHNIFKLVRGDELCGVIVYTYPPTAVFGRRIMLPKMTFAEMNKTLCTIARVVVHPKYRTIGLGAKLIRETLRLCGTPCVEMTAVMAKYNPFAEKAGMRKVAIQQPAEEAVKIAAILKRLGFNMQLLGSRNYNLSMLQTLSPRQIGKIRKALVDHAHPRLQKSFGNKMPFGITKNYKRNIRKADLERVAVLLATVNFLLQTKAYLFWSRSDFAIS